MAYLSGIEGFTIFIDYTGVTGETDEIHLKRLKQALERFRENNIRIKKEKSFFMEDEITYCGQKVDKHGIHKTQDKIEAVFPPNFNSETPQWHRNFGMKYCFYNST